ncbi:hypothetical protein L9F63_024338, partial [Diploptera punctata]
FTVNFSSHLVNSSLHLWRCSKCLPCIWMQYCADGPFPTLHEMHICILFVTLKFPFKVDACMGVRLPKRTTLTTEAELPLTVSLPPESPPSIYGGPLE